jgi:hypothetical protein
MTDYVEAKKVVTDNKASVFHRILARAPTYWRYLREDPSWIMMFLFARTLPGRQIERWIKGAGYRHPNPASSSLLPDVDAEDVVDGLIRDGMSLGLRLPAHAVQDICDFAQSTPCFSRDRQDHGFFPKDLAQANRERGRDIITGYYFEAVEKSATIMQLSRDAVLINIARAYIGCEPVHIRTRLWWSFPAANVTDADLHAVAQDKFHFDMNGWRTLKFFFYLTPTTERSGAHRCIIGSHAHRPLRHQLTLTLGRETKELEIYYPKDRFLTITGDAGTGFAEDPFLFHTGSLCEDKPRLILELEYAASVASPSYRYGRLG